MPDLAGNYGGPGWGLLGTGVIQVQPGQVPAAANPTREYLGAGLASPLCLTPPWTLAPVQEALGRLGHRLWDMMLTEGKVKGSLNLLKGSITQEGVWVRPAYRAQALDKPPGRPKGAHPPTSEDAVPKPTRGDQERAREIAAFCCRAIERLRDTTPIEGVAEELLHGLVHGAGLAENPLRYVESGQDRGLLTFDAMRCKPRTAWAFAVDRAGKVVGIAGHGDDARPVIFPLERFTVFQWMPHSGSPAGSPILDAAYLPWNTKAQLYPRYYQYLARFASPSLIGTAAENAQPRPERDAHGDEVAGGRMIDPVTDLVRSMQEFEGGGIIGLPFGSTLRALEIHGEGQAFLHAFDYLDREIVFAILWQVRATMEAVHGSRADSETATGILATATVKGRQALSRAMRKPFAWLTRLNFGAEAAELYTPEIDLGTLDDDDLIALSNAVAKLCESGFLAESQLPALDDRLKIPRREPGSPRVVAKPAAQGPEGAKGGRPPTKPQSKPAGTKP